MKKLISMILTLAMMLSLAACGGSTPAETTAPTEDAAVQVPASALEVMENIWANFPEEEQFAIFGGSFETHAAKMAEDESYMPANQPENFDLAYAEGLSGSLYIPADKIADIAEAATMTHMMNANTFTAGAIRLNADADLKALGDTMRDVLANNMWICGMPEQMLIAVVADTYLVIGFGVNDAMNPFVAHFGEAYPEAEILYNEPITG